MNKFATLKHIGSFKKVCFFSILLEGSSQTIYEEFYDKFKSEESLKEDIKLIITQLNQIGLRGAFTKYFRPEGSAEALPHFITSLHKPKLRLYCVRLSDEVVVLLSGGIKTSQKAQDCPNVSNHFRIANKISKQLTKAISVGEIEIDKITRPRLIIDKAYRIQL
jgi:hypothetical protein